MKPITLTILTTSADQDILADFILPAITAFIPASADISKIDIDVELLFDEEYAGDIVVSDTELGADITSKAKVKIQYEFCGKASSIVISEDATALEATVYF